MSDYMTVAEAAATLGVSRHTLDRWVRRGRLARFKVPGRTSTRFKREDITELATPVPDNEGAAGASATDRS